MNILLEFLTKNNSRKSNKIIQHFRVAILSILILGGLTKTALADLAINTTTDATALINALTGQDVTLSNLQIEQGNIGGQVGIFSGGDTGGSGPLLGISDGAVIITGTAATADGPNTSISTSSGGEVGPTDTSLATIENGDQFDTASLQFNVVPAGNTLSIEFIFASEEYNEFVCTIFNDAMGIFVSGPGIVGEVNIAKLDSNSANFSINQINGGALGSANPSFPAPCSLDNSDFFVDNITNATNPGETPYEPNTSSPLEVQNNYTNVEYDGFTIPLASQLSVQPGQSYTIKVVTADIGDSSWDGGVFVDAIDSFNLDYGDAPDSYGTTSTSGSIQLPGPARHSTIPSVYLGSIPPDAEGNGTPATSPNPADGDDNTGDDEDAFANSLTVSDGITSHTISDIPVSNTSGQTALLMGWIDFNQDGDFLDAGEQAIVDINPNQTTANLSWTGFSETNPGNTYARFRITTDPTLISAPSPIGLALDGEIEDHQVTISTTPNLLLVKRITAINEVQFNGFIDDPNSTDDDDPFWPDSDRSINVNTYLRGVIDGGQVKPGDEVEYTIYFLSNGEDPAKNVSICDIVPDNMSFVKDSYGVEIGIALALDDTALPTAPTTTLSNVIGDDQGEFFGRGTSPPGSLCKTIDPNNPSSLIPVTSSNNNGAVLVNLNDSLPTATDPESSPNYYGFIRFRAKVD